VRPEEDVSELLDLMDAALNSNSGGNGGMSDVVASLGKQQESEGVGSTSLSDLLSSHDLLDLWERGIHGNWLLHVVVDLLLEDLLALLLFGDLSSHEVLEELEGSRRVSRLNVSVEVGCCLSQHLEVRQSRSVLLEEHQVNEDGKVNCHQNWALSFLLTMTMLVAVMSALLLIILRKFVGIHSVSLFLRIPFFL